MPWKPTDGSSEPRYLPTPEELEERKADIRAGWSETVKLARERGHEFAEEVETLLRRPCEEDRPRYRVAIPRR